MGKLWIATIPGPPPRYLNKEEGWIEEQDGATHFTEDEKRNLAEFFGERCEWIEVAVN